MSEDAFIKENIKSFSKNTAKLQCSAQGKSEKSQKKYVYVRARVFLCVHNPTPGDSQACNYTLVGVKLIKAGEGRGARRGGTRSKSR